MKKKVVFVGLSGGVDSAVSATILKKQGFEVVGVFIKTWHPDFLECNEEEERRDAMRVAAYLDVPFLTFNLESVYKKEVADYMISEYKTGRTPNPDVMCNKKVKFGAFLKKAISMGADFVATGHYAQVVHDKKENKFKMLAGVDATKDQSYFLWTLGQEQLSKTFFPIGGYKKSQVRALAQKFGLPVAEKNDSQGLCFVGKLDMKDFLAHFIKEKEGSVLNEKGEAIGTHSGAYFYTLGERHGFTVTKKSADDTPFYVVKKDLVANTITVAHMQKTALECASQELRASQASFCGGVPPDTKKTYTAQVRYHGEQHKCKITALNTNTLSLRLEKPAVFDAGQSVVLYDGNECLGGGIIETT